CGRRHSIVRLANPSWPDRLYQSAAVPKRELRPHAYQFGHNDTLYLHAVQPSVIYATRAATMRGHTKDATGGAFPGSVLIADDHPLLREGLMGLLRRRLRVTRFYEADCFSQVLSLLGADDLALAVIDLLMPGLSGAQEIAQLRHLRPDVRIVVLSGS